MGALIQRRLGPKPLSLRAYHQKRNRVLFNHEKGGLGDVLMHRMIFDDARRVMPDGEFVFACLPNYMDAAKDHPEIAEVVDSRTVDPTQFVAAYNTCVTGANLYETKRAPCPEHRSDIWAARCGFELTSHEMRFRIDPKADEIARDRFAKLKNGKPILVLAPVSAMATKTLTDEQLDIVLAATQDCTVVALHHRPIPHLEKAGVPVIKDATIPQWLAYINAADYVVSVDTAAFHAAGGLKKPLTGIFTFADGKAYGKYFEFELVQKHRDNGDWSCGPCFVFGNCPKAKGLLKPCLTELRHEISDGIRRMLLKYPLHH